MAVTTRETGYDPAALKATSPHRALYVVKLGSATLRHTEVFDELAELAGRGVRLLVVTGGAADIKLHYALIGRPIRTLVLRGGDEVRYCPPEEMTHIIDAYEQITLPRVREELGRRGLSVFATTGRVEELVSATPNGPIRALDGDRQRFVRDHRAGTVARVDAARLTELLEAFDVVCVSPPVAATDGGSALNVDADVLAAEAALALGASHLRLVTGTAGLLTDPSDPASTLPHATAGEGMAYAGGRMKQKVRAAELALAGTPDIAITGPHTLDARRGTRFWRAPAPAADLGLLANMVELSSVSGDERELAEYLVDWCQANGVDAEIDPAGNLVATRGGGPRRLLMVGHMDTVPHLWPVRWDGETITGRGCVDAKGGLAAFLATLAALDVPEDATVRVIGTVEEERTAAGAFYARDHYPADAVIVGEPSGAAALTIGYHGVCKVRLSVAQTTAHTAGKAARTAASRIADAVIAAEAEVAYLGADTLFNVLGLRGGSQGGTQTAEAVLDVRVPPGTSPQDIIEAVRRSAPDPVRAEVLLATPAVATPRTSALVKAFTRALRAATGASPRLLAKKGSSDMNTLATTWQGVPMVAYGPGDASLDHTPDERLDAAEYRLATTVLADAVRRWLGGGAASATAVPAGAGAVRTGEGR
ncbi:bifunctional protein: acetyl-glutamate kinase; acetyl-ornithine deacetylase [Sphaerisporangium melleum]|uniref:Bifunctional protein: acetyl-glutamate kinase acetyl-ornithine deacetylase n=1 Tax=Sphaerisporangium melleum TaxID=321316 RepID=A0A917RH32_9ACTN|nr:M20/M25/M40 family metallo-hydrolase [Sphaerisporangium melleum]GGL05931.1 bifunctional protein: acetyl-glutamate kinase; acetyl-ornithine deacetylase [Sphaerisporangium melleum]GII73140.1 bifunctional protein: acetyl-glutamate kinase; acetyl-ornithine deacetylase [Sphaerisporangium melleum]